MQNALLPPGFYDVLPDAAEKEASAVEALMAHFKKGGYRRVSAPLMEFEDALLSGPGASLNSATFRVMDPVSQRMLGLRTDHTLQIGRIAASRLADVKRPLRLSYAGPVISVDAGSVDGPRQKTQVGVELIGGLEAKDDAEVIRLAASALAALGVKDVSVDLLLPTLVRAQAEDGKLDKNKQQALYHALDRKDEGAVKALGGDAIYETALALLRAGGTPEKAMETLSKLTLKNGAAADRDRLKSVLALLSKDFPAAVTVDLVETRCFEYQTGLSFAFYSKQSDSVLARGGRYRTQSDEPATGFTFYAETLASLCA
jgi:ATP phosphoribosyltransferase regulatory subunit